RARTLWSLTNRLTRKLLAHGLAVLANIKNELEPLQLSKTICYQ
ncbi:MAG: IS982 family transposase, partial [Proteobacteria bacterium]